MRRAGAKAQMLVRNKAQTLNQLGLVIDRLRDTRIDLYRKVVWQVFCHIVRNTPQYSGHAVANWTIGVGAPSDFYDPSLGRPDSMRKAIRAGVGDPLHKDGDGYWARVARTREKPKLDLIRRDSTVYISNHSIGDTDNGASSKNYLSDLQSPGYWQDKLREANKPYITVAESGIAIAQRWSGKKIDAFVQAPMIIQDDE